MMGSIVLPEVIPLPISTNAYKMLLSHPATPKDLPEYTILPLLQRNLELRISFQEYSRRDPGDLHTLLNEALSLDNDLAAWYEGLSQDYLECRALGRDNTINMWRVHQIVMQDVLVHCYYSMEKAMGQPKCFDPQVNECKAKAQECIDAILQSTPYISSTASTSNTPSKATSARMVLHHMTFSFVTHAPYRSDIAADKVTDTHCWYAAWSETCHPSRRVTYTMHGKPMQQTSDSKRR